MPVEEPTPASTTPTTDTPTTTTASAGQTPTTEGGPDASKPVSLTELPKEWQDHIRDLRAEQKANRTKIQTIEDTQKAKEQADLEKRQEWETLAKSRGDELEKLKPTVAEAKQLAELLTSRLNKEIASWPEEVKATAPEGEVSPLEMIKWIDKTKPLAEKLMSMNATPPAPKTPTLPGNGPGPTPKAAGGTPTVAVNEPDLANVANRF